MKEKKVLEEFDLDGLRLGMTVYHPDAGGKDPVTLLGVKYRERDSGISVQIELLYPDGSIQWADIAGLSTIPDYSKKRDALNYAYTIIGRLNNSVDVDDDSIRELAELVVDINKDVLSAKGW